MAVFQITDLLDVVLDSFIKTSATGGLGSIKAEVMADTAVALASGNVKLVSSKVRVGLHAVCVTPGSPAAVHVLRACVCIPYGMLTPAGLLVQAKQAHTSTPLKVAPSVDTGVTGLKRIEMATLPVGLQRAPLGREGISHLLSSGGN